MNKKLPTRHSIYLLACLFILLQTKIMFAQCNDNLPNYTRLGTYGNSVYYLSNVSAQPMIAQSAANSLGGYLVDINSQGENDFIQSLIDEMTYIGLNDSNSEGDLRWTSNAALTYTNYDNCIFCNANDAENDYAVIHPWNGGWSFTNMWSPRRYIVELACSDTMGGGDNGNGNETGSNNETCETDINGFEFIGKYEESNYFLSNNTATWTNANNTAQGHGGTLVVIEDEAENQFLAGNFDEMVYIGLNDANNEGQLSWADGSALGYENFDDNCGFCNDNDAENDYAVIHPWNAKWSLTNQWSQRKYLIEINCANDENITSTLSFNNCPTDRVITIADGENTAFVSWTPPSVTSSCAAGGLSLGLLSGPNNNSNLAVGSYTINYRAANNCGDLATCSFTIQVLADDSPTTINIDCPADLSLEIPFGSTSTLLSFATPNITTDCNTAGTVLQQVAGPSNNSQVGPGSYLIRYRATNPCDNQDECSFAVNVTISESVDEIEGGTVGYTANDQVTPYTGLFRPGSNVGYNPPWTDEQMADLVAGNPAQGVRGIGAKSMRPGLFESITAVYGYDFRLDTYDHYESLGLEDLTMIVGFPADWHKDETDYCGNGFKSSMFRNLYTDIWDDGANGTPYNDDNFYAAYLYELVSRYGSHVKFWEIWNEPGFDLTGNRGWRPPGDPAGNWWDEDPDPCEYILRAPIEHYVRTLRISWEIIKTLQPDDYVTVAGVGYVSFLDAILRNTDNPNGGSVTPEYPLTGGAYFDMMGFHSYPDIDGSVYDFNFNTGERVFNRNSDTAAQGIKKTQDSYQVILDKYGYTGAQYPKKEWIITEINVPRIPFRAEAMSGGEEMQVNYIIKAVALAMQNDITQMHVYNLGDRTTEANAVTEFDLYGLHKRLTGTEAYTQVRNLEAIAYKSAADFVWGSTYDAAKTSQMNLPNSVDGVALRLPSGRHKYIIWAKTTIDQSEFANASYSFPASFGYGQVYRRLWNFTDTDQVNGISSNNIALSGRPIFITETPNNDELAQRVNEDAKHHLSVYDIIPNPAVDEVRLILEATESGNQVIQIYNATGQLVEERETFLLRGFSEERFDISQYVHGMYYVLIRGAVMRNTKVKFVKAEK